MSFSGDGDSRLMKVMRVSVCSSRIESHLRVPNLGKISIPSEWFWIKNPSNIAFVQDVVYIAVKLKSRLVGDYIAGVHHLQIQLQWEKICMGYEKRI